MCFYSQYILKDEVFFWIVTLLIEPRKERRTPTLSLEGSEQTFTMLPVKNPLQ
jgi:hypothetical protein